MQIKIRCLCCLVISGGHCSGTISGPGMGFTATLPTKRWIIVFGNFVENALVHAAVCRLSKRQ